jgi:hypothetical protein
MRVVGETIYFFGWIFFLLLLFRFVMSWVFMFARDYTPHGIMLVVIEAAYTVTDPPVNLIRRCCSSSSSSSVSSPGPSSTCDPTSRLSAASLARPSTAE